MAVAVVLAGCAAGAVPPTNPREELRIATNGPGIHNGLTALYGGVILGTDNGDGTACFGTRPADQVPIIWPYGSSARRNPLRVLDAKGGTIAVDGQTVNLGGGFAPVQTGHLIGCGAADTAWVAN